MLNTGSNISSRISQIEGDGNCRAHSHGPDCSGVSHFPFLRHFSMRICTTIMHGDFLTTNNFSRQPSLYWTLSFTPQSNCISETKNPLAAGIINMVIDFVVIVLLPCRQYGSSSSLYSSRSLRCSSGPASSSSVLVPCGVTIYMKSRSVGIRHGRRFQPW
jgi:hypothetical protein